ncbi:hypothetical protein M569_14634, partial [Genlisea aurea]
MSENHMQLLFEAFGVVSDSIHARLSQFVSQISTPPLSGEREKSDLGFTELKKSSSSPTTKEELGRATWILLHTLAAQYPDKPTRQQKKDVKELMGILSRMYPCKECAQHFQRILRSNPVQAGTHDELSRWMCDVHNVVNRSLGKVSFPCERVDGRWGRLECENRGCDLE